MKSKQKNSFAQDLSTISPAKARLISIIIPTYNEEAHIREVIESCLRLSPKPEIIVCDGASADQTISIARELGARILRCAQRGRSYQMNGGARYASGETLLFLHADTHIDQSAWEALQATLTDPTISFGAFRRKFSPPSWLLSVGNVLAAWRGRIFKIFLGDQAIFVRKDFFHQQEGYRAILLFEDIDLCVRLRKKGRGVLIENSVVTSRRRFQAEGNARRLFRNVRLMLAYFAGADPNKLAQIYYPNYYRPVTPACDQSSSTATTNALQLGIQ